MGTLDDGYCCVPKALDGARDTWCVPVRRSSSPREFSFRFPVPLPWGRRLDHRVSATKLLQLPLSFTQSGLLSPDEFTKRAAERGVWLRPEQLLELHRRRALVPLLRIVQRPRQASQVAVASGAANGYGQYRSPIALVVEAAHLGQLADAARGPFRPWDSGLPLKLHGRIHRYPSVFYSPYQLLALRAVDALAKEMRVERAADGKLRFDLAPLTSGDILALDGCRQLAVLLSALDAHYLPRILLTIDHADVWGSEDPEFDLEQRLQLFPIWPDSLATNAEQLLVQASFLDPLGRWFEVVRQAHPDSWSDLKGDARLAMDYRIAAEILLRALDDLGRRDLSIPPPRAGRAAPAILDDRLLPEPDRLEATLTERGLSPHPLLLLIVEGATEMLLMPRVLAQVFEQTVPKTLIELLDMKSIDRDLDLLVRHVATPRFSEGQQGDAVHLDRAPTRILIAVDPEKDYGTPSKQRKQRDKLVRRLHESLPATLRSNESFQELK